MRNHSTFASGFLLAAAVFLATPILTSAQTTNIQRRITEAIDEARLTRLRGNTHPLARPEFDRGAAPLSLPMERMLLVLKRSPEQEAALGALLDQQQDKASPNYHQWLTPEEFGQQFGPADQDVQTVTSWLQSHGFQVARVSKGRTVIEFSGTARQVREAFHAEIHKYTVDAEDHWANANDPQIPAALAPVVAGIDTLHNFPRKPMHHIVGTFARSKTTGGARPIRPLFTVGCPGGGDTCYGVGPYDFATIYNVLPLWQSAPPIDGTGQTIAIVGRSNINIQDVRDFRGMFGLPPNDPQILLDGPDPGLVPGDETEADIDVQWAGAAAPAATVVLVAAQSTETSDGVDLAAEYVIDNNLAPILNASFGLCEAALGAAGNMFFNQLWQQAAAQGITVTVSSGDSGAAGCDFFDGFVPEPAQSGLQISGLASTPHNVSVGGTDFDDLNNYTPYWNLANDSNLASAKGYIPEMTWNDSCTNSETFILTGATTAERNCNSASLNPFWVNTIGGSGGKSSCINGDGVNLSSCTQGYAKPTWQTGLTPSDSRRDIPDISLFAGNGLNGNFYVICERDETNGNPCSQGNFLGVGGTSVSAPAFAGIMALVNQQTASRQGNANYILYKLAAQTPNAFHDVTTGTIAMPCAKGSPNCSVTVASDKYGVLSGYATTTGYDLATGLGSVNAANLVNAWATAETALKSTTSTLTFNSTNPVSITHGQSVSFTASVAAVAPATGTPTGNISLIANTGASPSGQTGVQGFTLNGGSVTATTNALPGGTYNVVAQYPGDGAFGPSTSSPTSVTVAPEASRTSLGIVTFDPTAGQITSTNATTFPYGSPYLLRADVMNSSSSGCFNRSSGTLVYDCPTGTIDLTDNGTALGPGTFALNSEGYAEYQAIQLTGGSHNLAGSYGGDASYNASSATDAVTVTPTPTTTQAVFNPPVQTLVIGGPSGINGMTNSQSLGAAPTGNFTVLDGSTVVGTSAVLGFAGSLSRGASCQGSVDFNIGPPSGQHTLTVRYSGDQNYAESTSAAVTVNAVYPTSTTVAANPTNVVYPNSVTLTAIVSTGNPASNAALKPTGTVSLSSSYGSITPVTTTVTQDASGNWMLQATATTTPQQSEYISANYSGDSNYASSNSQSIVYLTVTIPDFSISANPASLAITAGQTGTTTLTITPMTNYPSTVTLSCGPAYQLPVGATCAFSPSSVTLSNGNTATATFSLTTLGPSSGMTAMGTPLHLRTEPLFPSDRGAWWSISAFAGVVSLLLFLLPSRRRSPRAALGIAAVSFLSFAIGCGGGSSGGSGQTGLARTTTRISTSSTRVPQGSGVTLTATVSSSKPVSGSVTFRTPGWVTYPSVGLTNGTAQYQVDPGSLAVGTFAFLAQYSGDSSNQSSQSGSLNVVVTGSTQLTVLGQTSVDVHSIPVNVTIQ